MVHINKHILGEGEALLHYVTAEFVSY